MADPMAVKILVHRPSAVLVESGGKGPHFPVFLSARFELPQKTAKRVLKSVFGLDAKRVVSLPVITYLPVEDFPEEERLTWPKGAKTIPCMAFSFGVEEDQVVSSPYDWMYRRDRNLLVEKADKETLDNL